MSRGKIDPATRPQALASPLSKGSGFDAQAVCHHSCGDICVVRSCVRIERDASHDAYPPGQSRRPGIGGSLISSPFPMPVSIMEVYLRRRRRRKKAAFLGIRNMRALSISLPSESPEGVLGLHFRLFILTAYFLSLAPSVLRSRGRQRRKCRRLIPLKINAEIVSTPCQHYFGN